MDGKTLVAVVRGGAGRSTGLVVLIVLELVVFSLLSPNFLTFSNLLNVTRLNAEIGLIALGMAVVIASGGIDLSVGAIVGLSSVMLGVYYQSGVSLPIAITAAILTAIVCGFVNGLLVVVLRLHPLLVTLGTLSAFRGIAVGMSGGGGFSLYPDEFVLFGQSYVAGVPLQTIVWIVAAIVVGVVVSRTVTGRSVILVGTSEEPARLAGVRVGLVRILVYSIAGLLAGISSLIYTSRVFSSRGDAGNGLELLAIAVVVVGGASIRGGEISIIRTVLATIAIGLIPNGFALGNLDTSWQYIAVGALMVVVVVFNELPSIRRAVSQLATRSAPKRERKVTNR
jgi:ribose/xylose/arabinose/galactoside ABC-type transport system permease subunit